MANTPFKPTWAEHEKDAFDQSNAKKALKASDAFVKERDKQLKTSKQAREWEKDRKASIARQKPKWVKERQKEEHQEQIAPFLELKKGGVHAEMIQPMPGFVLIEVEKAQEKEVNGLIIPVSQEEHTTGHVVAVGTPLVVGKHVINASFNVGDKVMFKKFAGGLGVAGLDLSLQGKNYRLMRWSASPDSSDLLGVFHE